MVTTSQSDSGGGPDPDAARAAVAGLSRSFATGD